MTKNKTIEKYNRHDPEFHLDYGIIGFQQVQTNPDKVFIWMRDRVNRPKHQDRHETTRMANNSLRTPEWGKSVWTKEKVYEHLRGQLKELNIEYEDLLNLSNDKLSDKWVTNGDGDRNFLKAIIENPVSEITGEPFRIQITQQVGKAPHEIYKRALEESDKGLGDYEKLLSKYKNRACKKTYADAYRKVGNRYVTTKELRKVYVVENRDKLPVYEVTEITLGEPHHIFIKYEIPNEAPVDVIDKSTEPIENKMNLFDYLEDRSLADATQLELQIHEKENK